MGNQPQATPSAISASMGTSGAKILALPVGRGWLRQGAAFTLGAFALPWAELTSLVHICTSLCGAYPAIPSADRRQTDWLLSLTAVMKRRVAPTAQTMRTVDSQPKG